MKKTYCSPEAELISLTPAESVTIVLGIFSNPFDLAVAEDEAIEEQERQAASNGK